MGGKLKGRSVTRLVVLTPLLNCKNTAPPSISRSAGPNRAPRAYHARRVRDGQHAEAGADFIDEEHQAIKQVAAEYRLAPRPVSEARLSVFRPLPCSTAIS